LSPKLRTALLAVTDGREGWGRMQGEHMANGTFSDLDTRLDQFERRLQTHLDKLNRHGALATDQGQKIVELDEKARQLRAKLHAKLATAHGVDWELLKLELQNDFLLLTNTFRNWTRRLDSRFEQSG
jgi:hypothetical protein